MFVITDKGSNMVKAFHQDFFEGLVYDDDEANAEEPNLDRSIDIQV